MVLSWRGATLQEGQVEKVDLGAQDEVSCCMSTNVYWERGKVL